MICPKCRANNKKGSKFCGGCGYDLAAHKKKNTYRRTNWAVQFVCIFLAAALSLGFIFFLYSQNNDIADISFSELFSKKEASTGRISNRDTAKALEIAQLYNVPPGQDESQPGLSLKELDSSSSRYDLKRIKLIGKAAAVELVEDLLETDWPEAWVIKLVDSEEELIAVYRGDGGRIDAGDTLEVDGVFYAEHDGILAYNIRHLPMNPIEEEENLMWLYRLLILSVVWFVFSVFFITRKSISRKSSSYLNPSLLVLCLVIPLLMTGCEIVMMTNINEDGSGTVSTSLSRAKEDLEFVREIPEMTTYLDVLMQDFREQGIRVENTIAGEQEMFSFQRDFQSFDQLNSEADLLSDESWFEVEKLEDGDDIVFRYYGELNTAVLFNNLDNLPSYARDEATKELNASNFVFYVSLPGEVTYTNGLPPSGGRLEWEIRNNEINQIVAESRIVDAEKPVKPAEHKKKIIIIAIGALFLVSTLIFIIGFLSFKKRNSRKREQQ